MRYEAGAPTDLGARSVLLAGAVLEHLGAVPVGRGEAVERDVLADSGAWTKIQGICEIQGGVREPPASVTDEGGDEVLECDPEPMSTMRGVSDGSGDGASHHETDGTSGMMGGGSGGGMTHR